MRAINPPSFCTCAPPSLNSEKTLDGVDPANRQQQRASCVMLPLFLLSLYILLIPLLIASQIGCVLQSVAPGSVRPASSSSCYNKPPLSFSSALIRPLSQCLASTWFARVKSTVLPGGENDVLIKPNKEPILCSRRQRGRRRDGREGERRAKMDG